VSKGTEKYSVFCDFDGTITNKDTIDLMLESYADPSWLEIEEEWVAGKITSDECLSRQIACVKPLPLGEMGRFVDSLEIDKTFISFLDLLKHHDVPIYIVSDGFDWVIHRVLINNGLEKPQEMKHSGQSLLSRVFSNHLEFHENQNRENFSLKFPYASKKCDSGSGMCKCSILKSKACLGQEEQKKVIYIGDGRSDFCASKHADILYAKSGSSLLRECNKQNRECISFDSFKDIIDDLVRRVF
jgi:2,3-diketo-5-methylthio-1-phosphopentane phosphatase